MVCTMTMVFATAVTLIAISKDAIDFSTIVPAVYADRTRHFHVKVQARGRPVLTTQLFFPGEPRNQVDGLFRPQLLMSINDAPKLMSAQFDFVVDA